MCPDSKFGVGLLTDLGMLRGPAMILRQKPCVANGTTVHFPIWSFALSDTGDCAG